MFGLSRKERYERRVEIVLIVMFCDFGERSGRYLDTIKERYANYWSSAMKENLKLGNSPETTALVLAVIFYKDAILNYVSQDDIFAIRQCIIEKDYDPDEEINILFRMKFTFMYASRISGKSIPQEVFLASLRDIHRVIFGNNDDKLNDTVFYLIEGGNHIAEQMNEIRESLK